jgi:beta-phosphoglucomutase
LHRNLRALILDADGVLVRSMERNAEAYQKALASFGIEISEDDVFENEGRRSRDLIDLVARAHGRILTPDELDELTGQHQRNFVSFGRMPLYSGVERLLRSFRRAGLRLALVTGNWRENVTRNFGELTGLFDAIVTAEDVAMTKPDPEPYRAALAKLGLTGDDAVAVENAPLGIRSAKGAGLVVIAITSTNPAERLREADAVVTRLSDVLPTLKEMGWETRT